jgi:hypothetical protein
VASTSLTSIPVTGIDLLFILFNFQTRYKIIIHTANCMCSPDMSPSCPQRSQHTSYCLWSSCCHIEWSYIPCWTGWGLSLLAEHLRRGHSAQLRPNLSLRLASQCSFFLSVVQTSRHAHSKVSPLRVLLTLPVQTELPDELSINYPSHEECRWRMVSSGLLRRVALVRTDVSEEPGASFIRATKFGISSQLTSVASCSLCCS